MFTKHQIIEKVRYLFGELHHRYRTIVENEKELLPAVFEYPGGKISKGENYKGLPYLMLDYPAFFSKENIFAIRTMFWWGNFFSITLHLSGKYFENTEKLSSWLAFFRQKNLWVCVGKSEWENHFERSNYCRLDDLDEEQIKELSKNRFFKVAKKIGLGEWNDAPELLVLSFLEIIEFVKFNFPAGERVLSPGPPKAGSGL